LIDAAVNYGFEGIILTEHLDLEPGSEIKFDFKAYKDEINKINQSRPGKILLGLELGLVGFSIEQLNKFINENDFDCIIGSLHNIDNEDPYHPEFYEYRDKNQAYSYYFEKLIELLPKYPTINILGHFDYISRYSDKYSDKNIYYKDFADYLDAIFSYIIKHQIALEINTSTYRERNSRPANLLDINILKRYRELGGELLTLGSDAHSPADIGYRFQYFSQILVECGFKYIAHFKNRLPVMEKLNY